MQHLFGKHYRNATPVFRWNSVLSQEAQARIERALGRERLDALLTELSSVRALVR